MYKTTVKYTDLNGDIHERELYFNLSKIEMLRLQASVDGGLDKRLESIVNSKNTRELLETFEWIIQESYGEKAEDGSFVKTDEFGNRLVDGFRNTPYYDEFIVGFFDDPNLASDFVTGILPADQRQNVLSKMASAAN